MDTAFSYYLVRIFSFSIFCSCFWFLFRIRFVWCLSVWNLNRTDRTKGRRITGYSGQIPWSSSSKNPNSDQFSFLRFCLYAWTNHDEMFFFGSFYLCRVFLAIGNCGKVWQDYKSDLHQIEKKLVLWSSQLSYLKVVTFYTGPHEKCLLQLWANNIISCLI